MLVEGRNIPFLKNRSANSSIPVAFASSSDQSDHHHHCYHRPHRIIHPPSGPPSPDPFVIEKESKIIGRPPSFTGRSTKRDHHDPSEPQSSHLSTVICKLDIIITLLIIITIGIISILTYNRIPDIETYLLILAISTYLFYYYYYYYCFDCCSRTPLLLSFSTSAYFSAVTRIESFSSRFIRSQSQGLRHPQRHRPLLPRLVLFAMVGLAISANHGLVLASSRHSNDDGANTPPIMAEKSFANEQLREAVQSQFLKMMGLKELPRLEKHHKVPEYLLDLYAWLQQGSDSQSELDGDSDDDTDNGARIVNSLFGLSTDDLKEVHQMEPYFRNEISNRRVNRRRRSAQQPRATLQGPSNTIISHKIFDQNLNPKRDADPDAKSPSDNEAHLQFDISLPSDEFLTGAELRIYRHSVNEWDDSGTDIKLVSERPDTPKHNYFWPFFKDSRSNPSKESDNNYPYSETSNDSASGDSSQENRYLQRINIHHLLGPLDRRTRTTSKLIDTQVIDVRDSGWLSFDVFPAVEWWMKHPNENYGLLVTVTDAKNRKAPKLHSRLLVFHPENSERRKVQSTSHIDADHPWHELQPLIITFSNTAQAQQHNLIHRERLLKRSKRDQTTKTRTGGGANGYRQRNRKKNKSSARRRNICRRHALYFDFHMAGWMEWIVAPPGFDTFYCKGECSYPLSSVNKTNHAIMQSLVSSVNPTVVPDPCCVPTDLAPIPLLYLDEKGKVVLKTYQDMVVEGCGCQ